MPRYRLTQRARRDPLAVWSHIAEDSELYADRFIDRLMKSIGLPGANPYIGRRREHDLRTQRQAARRAGNPERINLFKFGIFRHKAIPGNIHRSGRVHR